jgi:hypothetical protein
MDIKNLFAEHKMKLIIVVGIIIAYILYVIIKNYILTRPSIQQETTIFSPYMMDVNVSNTDKIIKENVIPALEADKAKELEKTFQLTTFVYIYLGDFDTNLGVKKNIIFKPHSNSNTDLNFQWSISPKKNDAVLEVKLTNGLNAKLTIKDISPRTWTSISCVIDGNQAILYKNGNYYKSAVLNGIPIYVNSPILLGKGFNKFSRIQSYSGYLASFYISYKAESASFIKDLHNNNKPKKAPPVAQGSSEKCPNIQQILEGNILSSYKTAQANISSLGSFFATEE